MNTSIRAAAIAAFILAAPILAAQGGSAPASPMRQGMDTRQGDLASMRRPTADPSAKANAYRGQSNPRSMSGSQGYPGRMRGYPQGYPGSVDDYQPAYSGPMGGYRQGYPGMMGGYQQGYPGPTGGFQQGYPGMMGGPQGWPGLGGSQGWWPNMMGGSSGWPGMMGGRGW